MSLGRSQSAMKPLQGHNKMLSQLAILAFIVGYWFFAWRLERIDYSQSPPRLWESVVSVYPLFGILTPYLNLVFEFLSPRVLRHFIPLIVGWWLARSVIIRFLESFYDLSDGSAAKSLLDRLLARRAPGWAKVKIRRDKFEEDRYKEPLLRIGGPGRIVVSPGDAVVTERNGRWSRVLGPGAHTLGRFEYPFAVVDVRPQEREQQTARMVTADGIELTADVSATFQISPGSETPSRERPFPFDQTAVRQAAYAQTNLGDVQIESWESLALGITIGQLRDVVAEYRLDEIILPEQALVHRHRILKTEMERRARAILSSFGIVLRGTRLGRFELPAAVTEQHIDYWRSFWDRQRLIRDAEGEAEAIEVTEVARAEAEAMMIQALVEGFERVQRSGKDVDPKQILALRVIDSLESLAQQSQRSLPLPSRLLPTLGNLREQLLLDINPVGETAELTSGGSENEPT